MLLAAMCCLMMFGAPHGKCGENLKWEYDKKTKTLYISGSGPMYDYDHGYNSATSKTIYRTPWKRFHTQIESVIMAEGITHIGSEAFEDDEALRSCQMPNTLIAIGKSAFSGTGLTHIDLPLSLQKIGRFAFSRCYNLEQMEIPAGVTDIGGWFAFADRRITSFYVDPANPRYCSVDGVLFDKRMKNLIMYPLGSPATSYTVPDGIETIEEISFYRAINLKKIVLPESLKKIEEKAFEYCSHLESINVPGSVSRIERETFGSCSELRNVELEDGLTAIDKGAFEYCKALMVLEVPTTVREIHGEAFKNSPNVQIRRGISRPQKQKAVAQNNQAQTSSKKVQQTRSTQVRQTTVQKATTAKAATDAATTEAKKVETKPYVRSTKYGGPITQHGGLAPWTGVVGSGVY